MLAELKIELPEDLRRTLEHERGSTDPNFYEERSTTRFRCYSQGMAHLTNSPFECEGFEADSVVIVRNLSRTGLGLISHQQWFPEQEVRVELPNATIWGRVARVRRIAVRCYEIGVVIVGMEKQG
jgi:hypothetical protein